MSVTAKVSVTMQVVIEVGSWSGNESFVGLQATAKREARAKLERVIEGTGITVVGLPTGMSVVLSGDLP